MQPGYTFFSESIKQQQSLSWENSSLLKLWHLRCRCQIKCGQMRWKNRQSKRMSRMMNMQCWMRVVKRNQECGKWCWQLLIRETVEQLEKMGNLFVHVYMENFLWPLKQCEYRYKQLCAGRFLRYVMYGFRCSGGWRLSCIWLWDGSDVRTCLGRRTNYYRYLCVIHSDIGNVVKLHTVFHWS